MLRKSRVDNSEVDAFVLFRKLKVGMFFCSFCSVESESGKGQTPTSSIRDSPILRKRVKMK